jgi:ribosome-associated translation inhibitor RaiA
MQLPLQISFHGLDRSEALEKHVREQAMKLEDFCDRVTSCHVVLEQPHKHGRRGNIYHVRIHVAVPRRELVVDREPEAKRAHQDPYVTVRDAFKAMRRQIEDYVREIRGDVKTHAELAPARIEPESSQASPAAPASATDAKPGPFTAAPPGAALLPCLEAIRVRAYECWEAAGRPEGDGVRFWLEAERGLMQPT